MRRVVQHAARAPCLGSSVWSVVARIAQRWIQPRLRNETSLDKPALKALPAERYVFGEWSTATVLGGRHVEVLNPTERVRTALMRAAQRYAATPEAERVCDPQSAIRALVLSRPRPAPPPAPHVRYTRPAHELPERAARTNQRRSSVSLGRGTWRTGGADSVGR